MLTEIASLVETRNIVLREHKQADFSLLDEEAAVLRRELTGRLDLLPTPIAGVYTLQPRQYVGLVVLPTGRVIEIRPKVNISVLFAMLTKAHRLAEIGPEAATYTSVADLFEFVVDLFVSMVEDLVARGILRGFESFEGDLLALRGKVLVTETIRHRPVVRDRHWCAFTEFTADVPENRILKLTCVTLSPFPYRRVPGLGSRLRRLLRSLAEVTLDPCAVDAFDQLVYHRLNEHYRPALALARLLLSYLSPSGTRGPCQFLAFLVDMNTLFERYVTIALQEAAGMQEGLSVMPQDVHTLDLDRQVTVKPDVVVYRGDLPCLALDAKYKRDDPNIDVYQVLAYCHALGIPRAVLAYPASERIVAMRHRIRPAGGVEVALLPLDLSGGVTDLRRQTRVFAQSVWWEAAQPGR
jgi:5-methylcytosine-specific restriction enzyme subunit McrC